MVSQVAESIANSNEVMKRNESAHKNPHERVKKRSRKRGRKRKLHPGVVPAIVNEMKPKSKMEVPEKTEWRSSF